MKDISKAIVDGSLQSISEKEAIKDKVESERRDLRDNGNRFQRRAMAALDKRSKKKDAKIAALTRKLPSES
jgi:hypothetical protein